jgi:hypothetical protein
MTSAINTNGINVNYPVPGINNSSQGFRDNFTAIRTDLNTAATEITDLQNNVVLKQPLTGTTLNNDMANTLISNAATRGFRATTYNLGNAMSGTVVVNVSLGDVQYGTIAGNTSIQFAGWAPSGTQSNVQLQFAVSNPNAVLTFPSEVVFANNNFGITTLENYSANSSVTVPYGVSQLDYRLSSVDCGNTIIIEPYNRPRITTQVQQRTPSPTGFQGDVAGTVSVDANYIYVATATYDSTTSSKLVSNTTATSNLVTFNSATGLIDPTDLNIPVIFTGNTFGGIVANTVYYVKTIASANTITISNSISSNVAGPTFALTTAGANNATFTATFYRGTDIWKSIKLLPIGEPVTVDDLSVLGNAVIQGNLTVNGTYTYENITTLAIEDPIISLGRGPNNAPLVSDDNKDRGEQLWYYSGSEKSAFIGWDDSQGKLIAATDVSISSEVVTVNSYGNFLVGNLDATNINTVNFNTSGTFQANTISGNINAINLDVSGVANIPTVNDIRIGGGLNGYYLVTDGTGNLSWVSGGGSGSGVVAGSNTQIQYNNAGSFGSTAGFTFNSATNLLSTPGAVTATGNIQGANLVTGGVLSVTGNANIGNIGASGLITSTGNLNAGNIITAGVVSATGNITSGNLVTGGVISVTGNANVGNLGTAVITASGNITGGNIVTGGVISATGNANIGNIGTAGLVLATGNITGGNVTTNNYVIVSAANSISAAGTVQSNATQLTTSINVVTTVGAGSGVKLPAAEAGMRIIVRNSTSTVLNVYPNTGAAIEPALANAAYTLNATTSMEFFCSTGGASGQWFTLF